MFFLLLCFNLILLNSLLQFGPVVRPLPPGFGNGVSHCDAGVPVNYRLQLPETEKPPVSGWIYRRLCRVSHEKKKAKLYLFMCAGGEQ